ncbi:MAG: DUF3047 domain-containing protein [Burkholderiales bacterium]
MDRAKPIRRLVTIAAFAALLAACAHAPEHRNVAPEHRNVGPEHREMAPLNNEMRRAQSEFVASGGPPIASFSAQKPGATLSGPWAPWQISVFKRSTKYNLVDYAGRTVVEASADTAASGLVHPIHFDPKHYPVLSWRWKTTGLIDRANNKRAATEDSPVRILVAFEGDVSKLKPFDQLVHRNFKGMTKADLPFATLMYIWENRAPTGTVIDNPHTSRIKMIVADSGPDQVGHWCERSVNLYEDYRRAFGEDPPPVIWIGVMTDTDNTGETVRAYYGDIRVSPPVP